ncbi:hypothetical protein GCM10027203_00580 [Nonomuraea fastidiosa]
MRIQREALAGLTALVRHRSGLTGHLSHGLSDGLADVTPLGHRLGYAPSCLDQCLSGS